MSKESDLSEYEQLRLENIRRNAAFLAQLGLQPLQPAKVKTEAMKEKKVVAKATRSAKPPASPLVLRRSTRLSGDKFSPDEEATAGTKVAVVEEDGVNYGRIPEESHELDDHEFQAFVALRKWRLLRARELQIETYKIFQNRTLCEMIRRRRNEPFWARKPAQGATRDAGAGSASAQGSLESPTAQVKEEENRGEVSVELLAYDAGIADALADCWGVGPRKVAADGFAWEALAVLNGAGVEELLGQSRLGIVKVEPT